MKISNFHVTVLSNYTHQSNFLWNRQNIFNTCFSKFMVEILYVIIKECQTRTCNTTAHIVGKFTNKNSLKCFTHSWYGRFTMLVVLIPYTYVLVIIYVYVHAYNCDQGYQLKISQICIYIQWTKDWIEYFMNKLRVIKLYDTV